MSKFDLKDAKSLEQAIHQTVGYASVCWESMEGTGVFQSDDAHDAALVLQKWIEENYQKPNDNVMAVRSEESIAMEKQYLRQNALQLAIQLKGLDTAEDVTDAADLFLNYIKG